MSSDNKPCEQKFKKLVMAAPGGMEAFMRYHKMVGELAAQDNMSLEQAYERVSQIMILDRRRLARERNHLKRIEKA